MTPETERERVLREQLAEAHFQNQALTWLAAFLFAASLLLLALR